MNWINRNKEDILQTLVWLIIITVVWYNTSSLTTWIKAHYDATVKVKIDIHNKPKTQ